jgi:hypothetical protein
VPDKEKAIRFYEETFKSVTVKEISGSIAAGNAVRQIRERPTAAQTKSLKELEAKFKNQ